MDIIIVPTLLLIKALISFATVVIVADVIISWLIAANILNLDNQFVYAIVSSISRMSDFMLRPFRERIPCYIGALDISPVILILFLTFIEQVINRVLMRFM
ncbi:MAG: YggT family protein [Holosporaceae bacterium]|jgi:YggT family protein|nr:YggT family protein [Holosporaceae bacterium]